MADLRLIAAGLAFSTSAAFGQGAPLAPIEEVSIARDAFSTGTLDRASGALAPELWRGADVARLQLLLGLSPSRPSSPAIGAVLKRVLLSSGEGPTGASATLGGAKLAALARAGFYEEAREIESLSSGANSDPSSVEAMAIADILSGDMAAACGKGRRITAGLDNAFWVRLRVVCYASANELDAAELALGILRENGRLSETDAALLAPLAAGGKPKAPIGPFDAVQYAAVKAMGLPVDLAALKLADGGVVKAVSFDESAEWPVRLAAARRATAMGVMSGRELKALYGAAPAGAVGAFGAVKGMSSPELMRDRAGLIAGEIAAARDFDDLFALSVLYTDEIREVEGAILPASDAERLGLSRFAIGDMVGAERWLTAAGSEIARGAPDELVMRFIDAVSAFSAAEPLAAQRIAAIAGVTLNAPAKPGVEKGPASSDFLAPIVSAAIDAARQGSAGTAALAALAASDAAASGDSIAIAIVEPSLRAAGLSDIAQRLAAEAAIMSLLPSAPAADDAAPSMTPASAPAGISPRLKPKRSA